MSFLTISFICIASTIFGGVLAMIFYTPKSYDIAYKTYEKKRQKRKDKATQGMSDLEKSLWDVFN